MIYEYRCQKCGDIKEFWMKISDPHPVECPTCGPAELERVISKTSFALKGSGWYTTDYKRKESSSTTKNTTKTTCSSGTCSENKQETKKAN